MSRQSKINSKNQSFLLAADVQAICAPFFKKFEINGFTYSRVFQDGSRSELWSNSQALHHSFLNKKYISDIYTPDFYDENERYVYLPSQVEYYPSEIKKKYLNQLSDQKNIFNNDNCFIVVNKNNLLCEYFIFYTPTNLHRNVNFYLNHLNELEEFLKNFNDRSQVLIQLVDNDKIIQPWREIREEGSIIKTSRKLNSNLIQKTLTIGEMQVAQHILEGKTAKESAFLLDLSMRTIETHIDSIKDKYGCHRKSELMMKLINSNLFLSENHEKF